MDSDLIKYMRESILAKPSSRWMLIDGHPCATSDFFFRDGDDRPVALIDPHRPGWIFLDKEDADRREMLLGRSDRSHGEEGERAFETQLFQRILAKCRKVRRQVRCSTGVIDLLIDGKPPTIIEVKAIGDFFSVAKAAAQLWLYRRDYPNAQLFVAAPPPISSDASPFLAELGIMLWPEN